MPMEVLDDISFDGLGLLMFLIREKNKNNIVNMGYREIARRIGKGEHWVRIAVKKLTKKKLLYIKHDAPSDASKNSLNASILVVLSVVRDTSLDAPSDVGFTFEDVWKKYGRIGSKKLAKDRYNRLPNTKKKVLFESIPYYKAFHNPAYFVHLSTYIKDEVWNNIELYNGVSIPKDNYRIADVDRFITWFNGNVQGTNIPQISGLTPERYRMLNICYTLCQKEMAKVMKILLSNEKYIDMANKGMIDFDYIFKPENIKKICEKGGEA